MIYLAHRNRKRTKALYSFIGFSERCKNFTSRIWTIGNKGGRTSLPYAFTEQGIYMLMTVLKGDLAIKQSKTLIRLFKSMKDHLIETNSLLTQTDYLNLFKLINNNSDRISKIEEEFKSFSKSMNNHYLVFNEKKLKNKKQNFRIYKVSKTLK